MPIDMGRLNINSAGTPENFSTDLAGQSVVRAASTVKAITFIAPNSNVGNIYIGMIGRDGATPTVSSSYGITLEPGDSFPLEDISEKFGNFQAAASVSGDDVEWVVSFSTGAQA